MGQPSEHFNKREQGTDQTTIDQGLNAEFPQPQDVEYARGAFPQDPDTYARDVESLPSQRTDEYDAPATHEQEITGEKSNWLKRAVGGITLFTVLVSGGVAVKHFTGDDKETGSVPGTSAPATPGQTEPAAVETTPAQSEAEREAEANINPFTPVEMGGKPYVLEDAQKRAFVPKQEAPTAKAAANEIDSVYNNFAKMTSGNELTGDALVKQNRAILNKMFEGRDDIDAASKQLLLDLNAMYTKDGEYPNFKLSGGTFDPATGTLNGATMQVTKYKRDKSGFEEPLNSFSYSYTGTTKLNPTTQYWNYVAKTPFPMSEYKK